MESNNEEVRPASRKHRSWQCFKSLIASAEQTVWQNLNKQPLWRVGHFIYFRERKMFRAEEPGERERCVLLIDFEGKIDTFHRLDWINRFTFNFLIGFLLSTLRAYLKINRPINTSVFRKFSCGAEKWRNVSRRLPPPTRQPATMTHWGLKNLIMPLLKNTQNDFYCVEVESQRHPACVLHMQKIGDILVDKEDKSRL